MATDKYIYRHAGGKTGTAHLLVGYNGCRITDFIAMADELRKTFPEAKNQDIECGKITQSRFCRGFSIIELKSVPMDREFPGWRVVDHFSPEYYW